VGNVVMIICFFALFPFVIFVCVGVFHVQPHRWLVAPAGVNNTAIVVGEVIVWLAGLPRSKVAAVAEYIFLEH
jgi:hypothetical protein